MTTKLLPFTFALSALVSTSAAFAQERADDPPLPTPAPAPPDPQPRTAPAPYYYVPEPEVSSGPSFRALRPKRVRAMRPGALMLLFDYAIAAPIGSVRDYVRDVSFRGVQFDLRYWVHRAVSLGFGVGWQLFDQKKDRATYPIESGAITATLYRSVEVIPLLATLHVYPGAYGPVKPFVGLGVGPSNLHFQTLAADLGWTKSAWFFTLQPEAGVLIGRDLAYGSFGVNISARYTWLPATFNDVSNVQSFGGWLGFYSLF
jgi:hypothetical protein